MCTHSDQVLPGHVYQDLLCCVYFETCRLCKCLLENLATAKIEFDHRIFSWPMG